MSSAHNHRPLDSSFKTALSQTIRKALVEFWGSEEIIDQPEILVDLGPASIGRINRIGRKSLGQIARALDACGYINSSSIWLAGSKEMENCPPNFD